MNAGRTPFEDQVEALDAALADAEKHAQSVLGRIKALRKRNAVGELQAVGTMLDSLPALLDAVQASTQASQQALAYDPAASLSDGSYLAELKSRAQADGLTIHDADGKLTAFPLLLKLEPRQAGIRVGRKLVRTLRPSTLVRILLKAQQTTRFDAARFLAQLYKAYERVAPAIQPGWKPGQPGPIVPLTELYDVLTLHPAAAAEYPPEAFAVDLLRLDAAPDTTVGGKLGFTLPASTGSKGRNRLGIHDESGVERVFVGIQFSPV